jgi:predicted transcriptional regulator
MVRSYSLGQDPRSFDVVVNSEINNRYVIRVLWRKGYNIDDFESGGLQEYLVATEELRSDHIVCLQVEVNQKKCGGNET